MSFYLQPHFELIVLNEVKIGISPLLKLNFLRFMVRIVNLLISGYPENPLVCLLFCWIFF